MEGMSDPTPPDPPAPPAQNPSVTTPSASAEIARDVPTPRAAEAPRGLSGADGVRALAALWVFAHHLVFDLWPSHGELRQAGPWIELAKAGDMGVPTFFVLSGFLLSMPFWRNWERGLPMPDLRVYAVRRLARILPAYYLCVLSLTLVYGLMLNYFSPLEFFSLLTFTSNHFWQTAQPRIDSVLWTIGTEMFFYALLPGVALVMFSLRSRWMVRAWVLALILFIALANAWYFRTLEPTADRIADIAPKGSDDWETLFNIGLIVQRNALLLFTHFLIGMLAADVLLILARPADPRPADRPGPGGWFNRYDALAVTILGLIVLASAGGDRLLLHLPGGWRVREMWFDLHPLRMQYAWPGFHLTAAGLLVCLALSKRAGRWLDHPFLAWTATLSYGIYLWHRPCITLALACWPQSTEREAIGIAGTTALAVVLTYAVSALSYYTLEVRVLAWSHRYRPAPRSSHPRGPAGRCTVKR